jgi:hypothetical protein
LSQPKKITTTEVGASRWSHREDQLKAEAMTDEDEPNIVTSRKSQRVIIDGFPFSIEIYRLESEKAWTLEVVDHDGTSHVWDDQFLSDKDARNEALKALEGEGALAFMRGNNVIPFNRPK